MPDDFNFFDDDSLMPDWMRDSLEGEKPSAPSTPPPQGVQPPQGGQPLQGGQLPWDQHPGDAPPPPVGRSAAPPPGGQPPWEASRGPAAPPPARTSATPPWGESEPEQEIDELPQGMTGMLPWRDEAQQPPLTPPSPAGEPTPVHDEAWLNSFGFGDAGQLGDAAQLNANALSGDSDDLDWLQASEPPAPEQPTPSAAAEDDFAALFGGAPRTQSDDEDFEVLFADTFSESPAAPAAPAASAAEPATAFDDLSALFGDEFPEASSESEAGLSGDEFAWMDSESEEPEPPAVAEPPVGAEPPRRPIQRIAPAAEEPPAAPPGPIRRITPAQPPVAAESPGGAEPPAAAEPPRRPIQRLQPSAPPEPEPEPGAEPPAAAEPEEADMQTWLSRMGSTGMDDRGPDLGGMTYEEWEHAQAEKEREARKSPEERLLESGPDWFSQVEAEPPARPDQPAPPPQEAGPEFVPDWFLGLDEQPQENAPDWFRKLDFSADALSAPVSEASSSGPEPVEPGSAPDWFTGASVPGLDDSEWQAAFGQPAAFGQAAFDAPPPPEEPASEPPPSPIRRIAPTPPQPSEPGAEASGWMSDVPWESGEEIPMSADDFELPDFEAGDEVPIEDEFVLPDFDTGDEYEVASGDVPGWLSEAAPLSQDEEEAPAEDEFALPELDLSAEDELAPGEVPDWLTDTLQAGKAPADEAFPMPDTGLLAGLDEDELAPGDVPDWLTAGQDARAEPVDMPFPDSDLDQPMPAERGFDESPFEAEAGEDWMSAFVPAESTPGAMRIPAREDEEPEDFVERFDPAEAEIYVAPSAPLDADAPAWLREMAGEIVPDEPEELPLGEPIDSVQSEEESLDWLGTISAEDVGPEAEIQPEVVPADVEPAAVDSGTLDSLDIDQLLSLYEPEMPAEEPAPAPAEEPEILEEPAELLFDEAEASEEPAEPITPFEIGGVADWEWMPPGAADDVPNIESLFSVTLFEPTPGAEPSPDAEALPPAPEAQPRFGRRKPQAEPEPTPAETEAEAHPEWVAEMRPSDLPVVVKAGGAETSVTQKQVIELPDRLRTFHDTSMREVRGLYEKQTPTPPADSGPLAGITDALPAAALVLDAGSKPVEGVIVTAEQQDRLRRLEALLSTAAAEEEELEEQRIGAETFDLETFGAAEAAPEAVQQRARRARRAKPDRVILALALLVALIVPFATDTLHLASDPPALNSHGQAVGDQVGTLAAGQYVLFAMEYGPTTAGELDPLAQAVLRDVLAQGAIPLTISTDPAGAFHAQAVIEPLADDTALLGVRGQEETALAAGEDYVLLRFLSGEAVGVRSLITTDADETETHIAFRTDLRGDETGLRISRLEDDIALIVVVGGESTAVRIWAEQLNGVAVPKVALVTAAVEPLTIPYVSDDGYVGYLAGVRDTYSYDAARNADSRTPYTVPDDLSVDVPNPDVSRWHSMALGAAVAAGLIALGLVINLLRGLTRRGR